MCNYSISSLQSSTNDGNSIRYYSEYMVLDNYHIYVSWYLNSTPSQGT